MVPLCLAGNTKTRHVCETWMPPAATVKIWQNLYVLHFDPARSPGASVVSGVLLTFRRTYIPSLVTVHCMTTKTLNIALYM